MPASLGALCHDDIGARQRGARFQDVDRAVDVLAPLHVVRHDAKAVARRRGRGRNGRQTGVAGAKSAGIIEHRPAAPEREREYDQRSFIQLAAPPEMPPGESRLSRLASSAFSPRAVSRAVCAFA